MFNGMSVKLQTFDLLLNNFVDALDRENASEGAELAGDFVSDNVAPLFV